MTYSTGQGENFPTRPIWIIIAFHIGTHVHMRLGRCDPTLSVKGQNVQGPH